MSDVYGHPEAFGLKPFDTIEDANLSYEFDIIAVWMDEEGALWWAHDSGCSCPSPFEQYQSKADLSNLRASELGPFEAEVDAMDAPQAEKAALIAKVKQHLRG